MKLHLAPALLVSTLSFAGIVSQSYAQANSQPLATYNDFGLTQDTAATATAENGNIATLVTNASGDADVVQLYTYRPLQNDWVLGAAAALPSTLRTGPGQTPRVDVADEFVVVSGTTVGSSARVTWFFQKGSSGLALGGSLQAAANAWRLDPQNQQACPNSSSTTVPVPYNAPSSGFGSDVVITKFGSRTLIHVGDASHNNSCWPGVDTDGAVWIYELIPGTGGVPTPVCIGMEERIPTFGLTFYPSSAFGTSLASSETNVPDEGRLVIGMPGFLNFQGTNRDGAAYVLEIQETAIGFDHNYRGLYVGNSITSNFVGSRVSVSSEFAFIGEVPETVVLERQSAGGGWDRNPSDFPGGVPTLTKDAQTVLARPNGSSINEIAHFERSGGTWSATSNEIVLGSGSRLGRGAFALATSVGDRVIRYSHADANLDLYDAITYFDNGVQANSTGSIAQIAPSTFASVSGNNLTLKGSSIPANTLTALIVSSDPVRPVALSQSGLLLSGNIGRYAFQNASSSGEVSQAVDVTMIPRSDGTTFYSAVADSTVLSFQFYYRDVGGSTSSNINCTEAIILAVQ